MCRKIGADSLANFGSTRNSQKGDTVAVLPIHAALTCESFQTTLYPLSHFFHTQSLVFD
jgi:hypothetical protein